MCRFRRSPLDFGRALLVAAGICALVACHDTRSESFYHFLADAKQDGAIDRGWVPDDLIPNSSTNIHEVHDLSPSREWCAFDFAPKDSEELLNALHKVNTLPSSVTRVPSPGVKWWPSVLAGELDTRAIHNAGLEILIIERPETAMTNEIYVFAIDWSNGHGFFFVRGE